MAHRPNDEHDKLLDLENKLNKFRNSYITPRNNGVSVTSIGFGAGSKSSMISNMNGPWSLAPTNHNVGSFNSTTNIFTNNVADGSGYYHINLVSASVVVTGSPSPLVVTYIDGPKSPGQIVLIKPMVGKSLTLKAAGATDLSQGNIKLDADVTVDDHHIAILQFFSDIGTGGGKYIILSATASGGGTIIPWSNVTPIDVDKDMNNHGFTNFNSLFFKSSGGAALINTDGAGTTMNFGLGGINNLIQMHINSNSGLLEVLGTNSASVPTIKIFQTSSPILNQDLGDLAFDGFVGINQKTYVSVSGYVTNPSTAGKLQISALSGATMLPLFTVDGNNQTVTCLSSRLVVDTNFGGLGDNPLTIDNLPGYAHYACEGGHLFTGAGGASRFGAGNPNICYAGIEFLNVNITGASYVVDATNGAGTDTIVKMIDNAFTRNCQLPNAVTYPGRLIMVKNMGSKDVNMTTTAGQTVDSLASGSYILTGGTKRGAIFASDGSNWLVFGTA